MKVRYRVLIIVICLGFFIVWDYVDYNTEIKRISTIYEIPQSFLEERYPYKPFTDLPSDYWIRSDALDFDYRWR